MFPQAGGGSGVGSGVSNANGVGGEKTQTSPRYVSPAESSVSRVHDVGPCVAQLIKFNAVQQQHGSAKRSLESFWKPIVNSFFTSNALIILDLLPPSQHRSVALPVEAMPSILKSKFDAGVRDDRLLMEQPLEFIMDNGTAVVNSPKTTVLTTFESSKLCTHGFLRVSFTSNKKIFRWEFTIESHEELFTRDIVNRGPLPEPVCTPYGIPFSAVMLFTIAESINDMEKIIDHRMALLASAAAGNGGRGGVGASSAATAASPGVPVENSAGPHAGDAKSTGEPTKETSNIITQLNETASSMIPEKANNMPPNYSMNGNGAGGTASGAATTVNQPSADPVNQFEMDQPTSNPLEQPPHSNAQLQLARLQSAQQHRAMQSHPALTQATDNLQQHNMRNSVQNAQNGPVNMLEMFRGSGAEPGNQWQEPTGSIFAGASASDGPKPAVATPAGLSMFTPTDMFGGGAGAAGGAPNRPTNPPQNRPGMGGDPLPDTMSPFHFDQQMSGILNVLNGGDPTANAAVSAASAAAAAAAAAADNPVKRAMAQNPQGNGASKAGKRRRGGTQSSGVL